MKKRTKRIQGFYQAAILQALEKAEQQGKTVPRSALRRKLSIVGSRRITPTEFENLLKRLGLREGKKVAEWVKPLAVKVSSAQALIMKSAYYNPELNAQEVINLAVKNASSEKTRSIIKNFFERKPERVKKIIRSARMKRKDSGKNNAEKLVKKFERKVGKKKIIKRGLVGKVKELIKALEVQSQTPEARAELIVLENVKTRLTSGENSQREEDNLKQLIRSAEAVLKRRGIKV